MAYIFYNKVCESDFDNIVFKKDEVQDININRLKLEVHDTYKEDEKLTTNFEPSNKEYVLNKAYLEEKLSKKDGQITSIEKEYNEFKLHYNKQSVEILIQRAVKTTIQIPYDQGLIDGFPYADKVLLEFMFVTRGRADLEKIKDDVIQ